MKPKSEVAKTTLTIVLGLIAIYFFTNSIYTLYAALIIGVVSLFSNSASSLIHICWMFLAKVLSYVIPNIIMSLLFYVLLLPLALLQRLFQKNRSISLKNNCDTTFITIHKEFKKSTFEKPW